MKPNRREFCAGLFLALPAVAKAGPLPNGVYAVIGRAPAGGQTQRRTAGRGTLLYDHKYSDPDRKEPPESVTLDTSSFVPLILAGPPEAETDARGWTMLRVTLAREHVKTLENFTRAHLGGEVAIVLDGEIVTIHKVRSVIEDGKAQITRCWDNACQVLRLKLQPPKR